MESKYIWVNGNFTPWHEAKVHVMSHALHYGSSVFEGIRSYKTKHGYAIFRLEDHIKRLLESAKIYRFNCNFSHAQIHQACHDVLLKNNLRENTYIRPLIYMGEVGYGVKPKAGAKADIMIAAFPWGAYLGEDSIKHGIKAQISSWQRLAPNTMPTGAKAGGHYLSSLLIAEEALRHGYQEGIALDTKGYISEGSGENIFIVKNKTLITPPTTAAILPGLTRDCVMKLATANNYQVIEQNIPRESIYIADEVMMTGTAAEIVPVTEIDGIKIGSGKVGATTKHIQELFFGLFNGKTPDKYNWLSHPQ